MKHGFYQWVSSLRAKGIKVQLSLKEYLDIWDQSGKWKERGRHSDQYCMQRKDLNLPFSIDNVEIALQSVSKKRKKSSSIKKQLVSLISLDVDTKLSDSTQESQ